MKNDRISACADDELTANELDLLEDAFENNREEYVASMQLYQLIGAAMRNDVKRHDFHQEAKINALLHLLAEEEPVKLPWYREMIFPLRDVGHSIRTNWMPVAAALFVIGGIWTFYPKHNTDDITVERVRHVAERSTMGLPVNVSANSEQDTSRIIKQYVSAHNDISPLAVFEGSGFSVIRASMQPKDNYGIE